jgi:hypothetical protein
MGLEVLKLKRGGVGAEGKRGDHFNFVERLLATFGLICIRLH